MRTCRATACRHVARPWPACLCCSLCQEGERLLYILTYGGSRWQPIDRRKLWPSVAKVEAAKRVLGEAQFKWRGLAGRGRSGSGSSPRTTCLSGTRFSIPVITMKSFNHQKQSGQSQLVTRVSTAANLHHV